MRPKLMSASWSSVSVKFEKFSIKKSLCIRSNSVHRVGENEVPIVGAVSAK